jgi:hypothetical protein
MKSLSLWPHSKSSPSVTDKEVKEAKRLYEDLSHKVDAVQTTFLTTLLGAIVVFIAKDSNKVFSEVGPLNDTARWVKLVLSLVIVSLLLHYISFLGAAYYQRKLIDKIDSGRLWELTHWSNLISRSLVILVLAIVFYLILAGKFYV